MSEIIYNMKDSLVVGKVGEEKILKLLSHQRPDIRVQDLRNNKTAQEADVDFRIYNGNGKKLLIEVKTDRYSNTGNIFYEEHSNCDKNTLGCFEKTIADFVFYYFIDSETLYIINTKAFRKWYHQNKTNFRYISKVSNENENSQPYHSDGRLVPRKALDIMPHIVQKALVPSVTTNILDCINKLLKAERSVA